MANRLAGRTKRGSTLNSSRRSSITLSWTIVCCPQFCVSLYNRDTSRRQSFLAPGPDDPWSPSCPLSVGQKDDTNRPRSSDDCDRVARPPQLHFQAAWRVNLRFSVPVDGSLRTPRGKTNLGPLWSPVWPEISPPSFFQEQLNSCLL